MYRLRFAALVVAVGGMATPITAAAHELCDRTAGTVGAFLDAVRNEPQSRLLSDDREYIAFADERGVVWTFTKRGHPAHPAVVCRRPVQRGAMLSIQMQAVCDGARSDCDRLVADFERLNEKVRRELEQRQDSPRR